MICALITAASSGFSCRCSLEFSFPCPSFSPSKVYQAPDLLTTPCSTPTSSSDPSKLMPWEYMMSNSAKRKGGAHLFLATFARVRLPTISVPFLMASMRRMSKRTEE